MTDATPLPFLQRVRALFQRPRLTQVRHGNAPLAMAGGRTPIHVVAHGVGRLRIGDSVRFIGGRVDDVFFAPVASTIVVTFEGLFGRDVRRLGLEHVIPTSPVRVAVVADVASLADEDGVRVIPLRPLGGQTATTNLSRSAKTPTIRARRARRASLPRELA